MVLAASASDALIVIRVACDALKFENLPYTISERSFIVESCGLRTKAGMEPVPRHNDGIPSRDFFIFSLDNLFSIAYTALSQ